MRRSWLDNSLLLHLFNTSRSYTTSNSSPGSLSGIFSYLSFHHNPDSPSSSSYRFKISGESYLCTSSLSQWKYVCECWPSRSGLLQRGYLKRNCRLLHNYVREAWMTSANWMTTRTFNNKSAYEHGHELSFIIRPTRHWYKLVSARYLVQGRKGMRCIYSTRNSRKITFKTHRSDGQNKSNYVQHPVAYGGVVERVP